MKFYGPKAGGAWPDGVTLTGGVVIPAPEWHVVGDTGEPAFAGSFHNFGSPHSPARFALTASGIVHLYGVILPGDFTQSFPGATIFTLPAGFRPNYTLIYRTETAGGGMARINVEADGDVRVEGSATTYCVLDGISFVVEA